jgi:uncharacterized Ntn-hydrolase superfamily protein
LTNIAATFSIAAFDPETKSWGVAVQSKFLGVGAVVPWARARVGAVATQAMANAYEADGRDFAGSLLSALEVGQAAGGDRRG